MRKKIQERIFTALLIVGSLSGGANASSFLLNTTATDFSDGYINNGDSIVSDGVTITFSNVKGSNDFERGEVEGTGIFMSGRLEFPDEPDLADTLSFSFSFEKNVVITGYQFSSSEAIPSGSGFSVSGENGSSSNNTIPSGNTFTTYTTAPKDGINPYYKAGTVYTFTHNLPDDSFNDPNMTLVGIIFEAAPEPLEPLEPLEPKISLSGLKSGVVTIQSENGFTYSLYRSVDLNAGTEMSSKNGDGSVLEFAFDDSESTDDRGFFWIERRSTE